MGTIGKMIIDATKKKGGQYNRLTLPPDAEERAKKLVDRLIIPFTQGRSQ